jgi:hypothetical protein
MSRIEKYFWNISADFWHWVILLTIDLENKNEE